MVGVYRAQGAALSNSLKAVLDRSKVSYWRGRGRIPHSTVSPGGPITTIISLTSQGMTWSLREDQRQGIYPQGAVRE